MREKRRFGDFKDQFELGTAALAIEFDVTKTDFLKIFRRGNIMDSNLSILGENGVKKLQQTLLQQAEREKDNFISLAEVMASDFLTNIERLALIEMFYLTYGNEALKAMLEDGRYSDPDVMFIIGDLNRSYREAACKRLILDGVATEKFGTFADIFVICKSKEIHDLLKKVEPNWYAMAMDRY